MLRKFGRRRCRLGPQRIIVNAIQGRGRGLSGRIETGVSGMPNDVQAAISNAPKPEALYGKLEDRILARDQKGARDVYYELVRQRGPMAEIIGEAGRIPAPH